MDINYHRYVTMADCLLTKIQIVIMTTNDITTIIYLKFI